jgi:hypothetical protein
LGWCLALLLSEKLLKSRDFGLGGGTAFFFFCQTVIGPIGSTFGPVGALLLLVGASLFRQQRHAKNHKPMGPQHFRPPFAPS